MAAFVALKSYHFKKTRSPLPVTIMMLCLLRYATAYPSCTNPDWENPGYTYTIERHSSTLTWTFCKFPNPKVNHDLCGMPKKDGFRYICDPENMLTQSEALKIDEYLGDIATNTIFPKMCSSTNMKNSYERYEMIFILLDRIRVPDLSSNEICVNQCGEVHPTLNNSIRQPYSAEKDIAMETFALNIRVSLSLGQCENEAVVVYSRALNRIYTSFGARLQSVFNPSNIASFHEAFIRKTKERNDTLFEALEDLVDGYRLEFQPTITPAQIILLICLLVVSGLAVFLYFFSHLKPVHINVWEENLPGRIIGRFFRFSCGIWIMEVIIFLVIFIERKAVLWQVIAAASLFLSCLIVSGLYSRKRFP